MPYLVPPAGTPLTISDILSIKKDWIFAKSPAKKLAHKVREISKTRHCFLFNSGRTALYFILKALSQMAGPDKNEIIIPAYTCFSVAAAIVRCGMTIHPVDIDPNTLDYDYDLLAGQDFSSALAVMGCNLFGIISDWDKLREIGHDRKVFLIDDAAQSMGLYDRGKASGSFGDAGFYSLGRGKNISAVSGGIMITDNDDLASVIEKYTENLKRPGIAGELNTWFKLLSYGLFIRPELYWIPDGIPFLGIGETIYDVDFKISRLGKLRISAADRLVRELDQFNIRRKRNAGILAEGLAKTDRYSIPGYIAGDCPAYLRLPILTKDGETRDSMIGRLRKTGISASRMYPSAINRISGIDKHLKTKEIEFKMADDVARKLLTLPTHPLIKDRHLDDMIECLTG